MKRNRKRMPKAIGKERKVRPWEVAVHGCRQVAPWKLPLAHKPFAVALKGFVVKPTIKEVCHG